MHTFKRTQEAVLALLPEMTAWRRYLHQHPELSYKEQQTAAYLAERLRACGCDVRTGVGGHGLIASIRGALPGPVIALRADMDALPIQDEKDVPYKSTVPGVMHACGHDAHCAALLATARYYCEHRASLRGERRLLFQPAEEVTPGGAQAMIRDGALAGVEVIYGVHLWTPLPYGKLAARSGPFMAAPDEFAIEIQGAGGHGGLPHETVDAIVVGSALVQALQTITSRSINPLEPVVVSVGAFHAGHTCNVIAGEARLKGTVRTFDPAVKQKVKARLEDLLAHTCAMHGAQGRLVYTEGYPPVCNPAKEAERFFQVGAEIVGGEQVEQSPLIMAGEDFSYFLNQIPGCFMLVGAGNPEIGAVYPHHHPRFDVDERAMLHSAQLLIGMAEHYADEALTGTMGTTAGMLQE